MKQACMVLSIVALIFITTPVMTQAAGPAGRNFNVTVSMKAWYVNWQETITDTTGTGGGTSNIDDSGLMYGPAVNIRFKRFFTSISYLTGGDFSSTIEDDLGDSFAVKADRSDMDISFGYTIHPRISCFVGFKHSKLDVNFPDFVSEADEADLTLNGIGTGISGNYPIGRSGVVLFGTLGLVVVNGEWKYETPSVDSDSRTYYGPSLELGVAYVVPRIPLSVTVGGKYQQYTSEEVDGNTLEDKFTGLTTSINYTF